MWSGAGGRLIVKDSPMISVEKLTALPQKHPVLA
jgi:hypothetical protein